MLLIGGVANARSIFGQTNGLASEEVIGEERSHASGNGDRGRTRAIESASGARGWLHELICWDECPRYQGSEGVLTFKRVDPGYSASHSTPGLWDVYKYFARSGLMATVSLTF